MDEYIEEMVDLQLEIHSKKSPRLIKLKDQLRHDIESLDCIDATRKYELLTRLESMPTVSYTHLDVYKRQALIMSNSLSTRAPVFADMNWMGAYCMNASVARMSSL